MTIYQKRPPVLASALAVALGAPLSAHAIGIEVNSLGSAINANDGVTTLREAIQQANSSAGTDIITFNSELSGTIQVGSGKELDQITDNTLILGNGNITLDAQGAPNVIRAGKYYDPYNKYLGVDTELTISGLTLTGASEVAVEMSPKYGGSLTVEDTAITGNSGAAVYSENASSTTIKNSTISGNGSGGKYGAILQVSEYGSLQILDSTISGNNSTGPAVMSFVDADFNEGPPIGFIGTRISGSTISNNTGGGAMVYGAALEVESSVISGNSAQASESSEGNGGGLYMRNTYATISDSTIRNNTAAYYGGGIHASGSTVTLAGSTVSGNRATSGSGGGIYFGDAGYAEGGSTPFVLTLQGSTVSGNRADSDGAGIYFDGSEAYGENAALVLNGTRVTGNTITGEGSGGGIHARLNGYNTGTSEITIVGSQILDNSSLYGEGGGANLDVDYSEITIASSVISGNSATGTSETGYHGGGLSLDLAYTDTTIARSTISDNESTGYGGGIEGYLYYGSLSIEETVISGNSADNDGGGVALGIGYTESTPLTVVNSTLSGNNSAGMGGAIATYAEYDGLDITLTNSTVTDNSASGGAGAILATTSDASTYDASVNLNGVTMIGNVTSGDTATGADRAQVLVKEAYGAIVNLEHTVVSGNSDGDPDVATVSDAYYEGTSLDFSYSLVGSYSNSGGGSVLTDEASSALAGDDPMLDVLANNGGLTQTMMPMEGSPLINGGSSVDVAALDGQDQRGSPRLLSGTPVGGNLDIGAVEILDDDEDGVIDDLSPVVPNGLTGALGGVVGRVVDINVLDYVSDPEGYTFNPAADIEFEGLPTGLTYNPDGTITGTLEVAGQYVVTAWATDTTSAPTLVQKTVTVLSEPAAADDDDDGGVLGGLTPGWLLVLAGMLGLGRRRR